MKANSKALDIARIAALLAMTALCVTSKAVAWDCPAGQQRVQAPPGTPTTTPYYDVVEGIAFICQPIPTTTVPPVPSAAGPTQSQNQNQSQTNSQNQSQNASLNSTQNTQNLNSSSSGSFSKSNSGSTSASNSTSNSTSTSTSSSNATGGSATGGTANSSSSNNSSGNQTSVSSSETYNEVRQNPGANAPVAAFTTSPCSKGYSGGVGTPSVAASLGIVLTDKGCDSRQTAVIFHGIGNDYAAAKILCSTSASKRAKLTLTECLQIVAPLAPVVVNTPAATQPLAPPIVIVVPEPTAVPAPVEPAIPIASSKGTIRNLGTCPLNSQAKPSNACYRLLDDAVVQLENHPNAHLVLSGPVEASHALSYVEKRISRSRIELRLSDDENYNLTAQIWDVE
jgi:hypothetical protein